MASIARSALFAALLAAAVTAPAAAAPAAFVPDSTTILSGAPSRTPVSVNEGITQGYIDLAKSFQGSVVGEYTSAGARRTPMWFAFGVHASHEVGVSEVSAELAKHALTRAGAAGFPGAVCSNVAASGLLGSTASAAVCAVITSVPTDTLKMATAFAVQLVVSGAKSFSTHQIEALLNTDTVTSMAQNVYDAMMALPASSAYDKLVMFIERLENCLKSGNIAIFSDIGARGERFLRWWNRQSGRPTAEQVISAAGEIFPAGGADDAVQADDTRTLYSLLMGVPLAQSSPLTDNADVSPVLAFRGSKKVIPEFYTMQPFRSFAVPPRGGSNTKSNTLLHLAFALYTGAGDASDTSLTEDDRSYMIRWGNVLLAYREQAISVHPTFTNPDYRPIMKAMTPLVAVGAGKAKWTLVSYVQSRPRLPPTGVFSRIFGGQKPPMSMWDWTYFDDYPTTATRGRWLPINDAFRVGYAAKDDLWKFPAARP